MRRQLTLFAISVNRDEVVLLEIGNVARIEGAFGKLAILKASKIADFVSSSPIVCVLPCVAIRKAML